MGLGIALGPALSFMRRKTEVPLGKRQSYGLSQVVSATVRRKRRFYGFSHSGTGSSSSVPPNPPLYVRLLLSLMQYWRFFVSSF
jgi:hypothetical protein